jgi:choline dehydrogenase-like flavoprotein
MLPPLFHCSCELTNCSGDKAIGVEYVDAAARDTVLRAYASKLVVVAAGTFGSPAILERYALQNEFVL